MRAVLVDRLTRMHIGDPDTLTVPELGLCQHAARIDFAVINGLLSGYEIKSDADTLQRLPGQAAVYNRVFDRVTIVCGLSHVDGITRAVPAWWGIDVAIAIDGVVVIRERRPSLPNPSVDAAAVVQLLWKAELQAVLSRQGASGIRSMNVARLWAAGLDRLSADQVRDTVRAAIKARESWRSGPPRSRGGDRSPPTATSSRSRSPFPVLQRLDPRTGRPR